MLIVLEVTAEMIIKLISFDMASNALDTRKGLMEAQLERVIKLSGQYRAILEKNCSGRT